MSPLLNVLRSMMPMFRSFALSTKTTVDDALIEVLDMFLADPARAAHRLAIAKASIAAADQAALTAAPEETTSKGSKAKS